MTTSNHLKSNGAKLIRLIVDVGTETMRNYFDSIHPPATLNAVLHSEYDTLRRIGAINRTQMQTLFPPSGMHPAMPSTSNDYDITLLFILIRNICGLTPPASQPRTQALSTTRLAGGKTLVQAGHVSPRFWEITTFLHEGEGLSFILPT
jgi:hypothetical protein